MNKVYIVRGDTCEPWDYQVYGAFSDFNSAMIRAAKMIQKLKRNGDDDDDYDCYDNDWTGLVIESFEIDDPEIPSHYGDSCYSACKECHDVTLQELLKSKLI